MMYRIAAVTGLAIGAFALAALADSWTPPSCGPTGCNVPAPINVGGGGAVGTLDNYLQTKTGALTINGFLTLQNLMFNPTLTHGSVPIGSVLYSTDDSGTAGWTTKSLECGSGNYLQGIDSTGAPECAALPGSSGTSGSDGSNGTNGTSVPSGAVMAFDVASCASIPGGWSDYAPAQGRFIIGSTGNQTTYPAGKTGGTDSHKLNVNELPSFSTSITLPVGGNEHDNEADQNPGHTVTSESNHTYSSSFLGTNNAFSIMPPWVALTYCEKN